MFKDKKGITLILAIMLMTMMLFMSMYYLNFSITERKISDSQSIGEKTYYLAESGISEMIFRLKNDPSYRLSFHSNPSWSTNFTRNEPFGPGSGTYSVSIANTDYAYAEITATGTVEIANGGTSQRVIKTKAYRLIGETGMGTNAVMNGTSTFYVHNSDFVTITGDVNSNGSVKANGNTVFDISGNLSTAGEIQDNGSINVTGSSTEYASSQLVPGVNFTALEDMATTFIANDAAMDATSSISGIIWASTTVDIENDLVVNGLLIVNGNLTIRDSADITVIHATGTPSGIMVIGNIIITDTGWYRGNFDIEGILYATGGFYMEKLHSSNSFNLDGGIASGNGFEINNCDGQININFNNEILDDSLESSSSSPVIATDHWEEEY